MPLRLLVLLSLALCSFADFSSLEESYIDAYKELAVVEMHRTGIPASVTLAQGLLESNNGQSRLAVNANNHFGIKCKSYWKGNTFFHKDDDRDRSGRLVESCFRSYQDAMDSYIDHSNFLKLTPRYGELFEYSMTDYESWAKGLKKCGYATDKNYATSLIKKIEENRLYQYDFWPYPLSTPIKN